MVHRPSSSSLWLPSLSYNRSLFLFLFHSLMLLRAFGSIDHFGTENHHQREAEQRKQTQREGGRAPLTTGHRPTQDDYDGGGGEGPAEGAGLQPRRVGRELSRVRLLERTRPQGPVRRDPFPRSLRARGVKGARRAEVGAHRGGPVLRRPGILPGGPGLSRRP